MKALYVDNFRGFNDTLVPLCDVNFLVGENSTGKTSILSVLNLLSETRFWFEPEFNNEEIEFGNFEDIMKSSRRFKRLFYGRNSRKVANK